MKQSDSLKKAGSAAGTMGDLSKLDLNKIITDNFVSKYTMYETVRAFMNKSGFGIHELTGFSELSNSKQSSKLNKFIKNATSFNSWQEMVEKAAELSGNKLS